MPPKRRKVVRGRGIADTLYNWNKALNAVKSAGITPKDLMPSGSPLSGGLGGIVKSSLGFGKRKRVVRGRGKVKMSGLRKV